MKGISEYLAGFIVAFVLGCVIGLSLALATVCLCVGAATLLRVAYLVY